MSAPKFETQQFEVTIPDLSGEGIAQVITIPVEVEWDDEVKEWLLTPDALRKIEDTKARHMGLLLPAQLKELRERYNYTQKEMGELFQVGEKSWTRWESGKHRPSRSINLLIRALYENEISINYLLKRAGKPPREVEVTVGEISHWFASGQPGISMNYGIVPGNRHVRFHASGKGKSEFMEMFMHQARLINTQPWSGLTLSKESRALGLECTSPRFDYQNAKIA